MYFCIHSGRSPLKIKSNSPTALGIILVIVIFAFPSSGYDRTSYNRNDKIAQKLFKEILCVVCTGQSIAESDTKIAKQLKTEIISMLNEGKDSDEIKSYLAQRYGDQILTTPPVNPYTYFLWLAPIMFVILMIYQLYRKL